MKKEHRGFLFGILAAFMNSLVGVSVKFSHSMPTPLLVFFRFFLGFLILYPWMHSSVRFSLAQVPKHLTRSLAGVGAIYCFFYSLKSLPLVNALTFLNTAPLFLPLIYFFWKKLIIPKKRLFSLLIGFLGVVVILRPSLDFFETANFVGLMNGLLGAFSFASVRELTKSETTQTILFYFFLISTFITAIPALFFWKAMDDSSVWIGLFFVGLTGAIYQYFLTKSYEYLPATKSSVMIYLAVVFGGVIGWFLYGEKISFWELAGILLIIAGGIIALFDKSESRTRFIPK